MGEKWGGMGKKWVRNGITGVQKTVLMHASAGPGDGHTCVRCGGQFKLSLSAPGAVLLNYVYLQPGQWGRVPGLP